MSGNQTLVPMKRADGTMDSIVHLPDATTIKPAADGTIMVPGIYVIALMMGGYMITVAGGHVP